MPPARRLQAWGSRATIPDVPPASLDVLGDDQGLQPAVPALPRGARGRAVARRAGHPQESFGLIDQIAEVARPVLILSGGEPLYRPDIFDIGAYGFSKGFRMALATNGTMIDAARGGADPDTGLLARGDQPRRCACPRRTTRSAAFRARTRRRSTGCGSCATRVCRSRSTRRSPSTTSPELPALLDLALSLGADALHIFMLVPVGCGVSIADREMLPADEYERVLHWFYDQSKDVTIDLKATCAPHYFRVRAQRIVEERQAGRPQHAVRRARHAAAGGARSRPAGGRCRR